MPCIPPFSRFICLQIDVWGPYRPSERMSIVVIRPIDENVAHLAAFLAWLKPLQLKAVKVTDNVMYPHFTWKEYHFSELSRDPSLIKRPKMPVRPNNAYHVLLHGMKHKTLCSISRRFHFHSKKVVQHYNILSCSFLCF